MKTLSVVYGITLVILGMGVFGYLAFLLAVNINTFTAENVLSAVIGALVGLALAIYGLYVVRKEITHKAQE